MTAPGSNPGDGLLFSYVKDLLLEARRPLSAGDIAARLGWSVDEARRIAGDAAEAGLLDVSNGRYSLTGQGAQR